MSADSYKRAAAARAIDFVRSGMRLGLGTGSTAQHFVELLGERVRAGLDVIADESKWVSLLGAFPLPIEIAPFGAAATLRAVETAAADAGSPGPARLRRDRDGHAFVTDGG